MKRNFIIFNFIILLHIITSSTDNLTNNSQSLIIPQELGSFFEGDDYSNTSCIFLQFLNLTMFTLNNYTIPFNDNSNLQLCSSKLKKTCITDLENSIIPDINVSTYIQDNEVHIVITNSSSSSPNTTDYYLRCYSELNASINQSETIIYIPRSHCFTYKIQNFLYEKNHIFSSLLLLSGLVILYFGNAYPKTSIIITCIYILFYSVQLLFDLIQFNALAGKQRVNVFYWGLFIIVLIFGPFLGVLITLSANIFKFAMGFFGGYLGFKVLLYHSLLLKFNNPVAFNQYIGVIFHVIVGIGVGIAFIFIKHTTLCMWIATSVVGAYMMVIGFSLYAGGFANEMYAASLARCGDFKAVRGYLNRGITWFYFVLFVLLSVSGAFFQNWKGEMEMKEEKPIKKKKKQELDIGAKNYQLMDKSSAELSDEDD